MAPLNDDIPRESVMPVWAFLLLWLGLSSVVGLALALLAGCSSKGAPPVSYVHGDSIAFTNNAPLPKVGDLIHFPAGGADRVTSVAKHAGRWYVYFPGMDGP